MPRRGVHRQECFEPLSLDKSGSSDGCAYSTFKRRRCMPSRVRDRPYAPQFKPQLCQKIRTDALGRLPLGAAPWEAMRTGLGRFQPGVRI